MEIVRIDGKVEIVFEGLRLEAHEAPYGVYTVYGADFCKVRRCFECGEIVHEERAESTCRTHEELYFQPMRTGIPTF